MTGRWSDVELIRLCREGIPTDVFDAVVAAMRDRLHETSDLRQAVLDSPQAMQLMDRLGDDAKLLTREPPVVIQQTRSGTARLVLAAGFVAAIGGWLWWQSNPQWWNAGDRPVVDATTVSDDGGEQLPAALTDSEVGTSDGIQTSGSVPRLLADAAASGADAGAGSVTLTAAETTARPATAATSATSDSSSDNGPAHSAPDAGASRPAGVGTETANSAASAAADNVLALADPKNPPGTVPPAGAAGDDDASNPDRPSQPWDEDLNPDLAPRRFEDVAWLVAGMEGVDEFSPTEFRRWFSAIRGRPFQPLEEKHANRTFTRFDGEARLLAPWPADAVLHLSLYDMERCAVVLWNGNEGLRVRYYHHTNPKQWCAHRVVRANGDAPYEVREMLNSDIGRWQRASFGDIDLRWLDGTVRLMSGPAELLRAPLARRPDDVQFEGRFKFRQVRMMRVDAPDEAVVAELQPADSISRHPGATPDSFEWTTSPVDGVSLKSDPATRTVELNTLATTTAIGWASIPAPQSGLSEFVFRVDDADVGTGVCIGRADGSPAYRLARVWDPYASRAAWNVQVYGENHIEQKFDRDNLPEPWAGPTQWLKLVTSQGFVSAWVSPDGHHWGLLADPRNVGVRDLYSTIGIYAQPGGDRRIRLAHIEIRDLPMLASVADPDLVARVNLEPFHALDLIDIGAWTVAVLRSKPRDVELSAWRRACAVATLKAVTSPELSPHLVSGLLTDGLFGGALNDVTPNIENGYAWKLLAEASLLTAPHYDRGLQISQLYHEVARLVARFETDRNIAGPNIAGRDAEDDDGRDVPQQGDQNGERNAEHDRDRAGANVGEARPKVALSASTQCMTALVLSPYWSTCNPQLTPLEATSLELVQLVEDQRFDAVRKLIDQTVFWNCNSHPARGWWGGARRSHLYDDRLGGTLAAGNTRHG